jgi:hypothetical protein
MVLVVLFSGIFISYTRLNIFYVVRLKNKLKITPAKLSLRYAVSFAAYLFSSCFLSALLGHNVYPRQIILPCREKDWLWLIVPGHV